MHAVDGGTTYGLPYDSLLPPVREEGKAELSCVGAVDALCWWMHMCSVGGFQLAHRPLSPRGLCKLCLREAEVAADCWRRRNGLPAAAEAEAGGVGGASGSGGQGTSSSSGKAASSRRQHRWGEVALRAADGGTGRHAGLCRMGGGAGSTASGGSGNAAAAHPPRATLDPNQCPALAVQAMSCSLELMDSSCGAGAGESDARASKGTGSGAGGSGGTDRIASSSGSADMGEGAAEAGGGGIDGQGPCSSGSGNDMQEAAAHEEAGGSASVGVSGSGTGGQGGGAGAGTSSGGCGDAAEETYGSGSGGGKKRPVAWLAKGGPLARRWWRAAVAAVHCALDEREAVGSQAEASGVDQVLDPFLAMPETDPGGTQHPGTAPTQLVTTHSSCSVCRPSVGYHACRGSMALQRILVGHSTLETIRRSS